MNIKFLNLTIALAIKAFKFKFYLTIKFLFFTFSFILKIISLAAILINKINPDSLIFGAIFFTAGLYAYGDKFKTGETKKQY